MVYNKGERVTMKFGDYLDCLSLCIESDGSKSNNIQQEHGQYGKQIDMAYLAQNKLFSQVQNDIPIPQFVAIPMLGTILERACCTTQCYGWAQDILSQWAGNVFCCFRLIAPLSCDAPDNASNVDFYGKLWHYAGVDRNQCNTSAVDIKNPD
ncbi:hypothetical protein HJC23_005576 [Cyclotella cryptica]|uniref:Uncharacterized protein n=1 Tax=Cyclotella cryptica TaxID=29204 RepID=A0ABD3PR63_9STRA